LNRLVVITYVIQTVLTRKVAPHTIGLATTPKHVQEFIQTCGDEVIAPSTEIIQEVMDMLVKMNLLKIYGKIKGSHTTYTVTD